jgi:aldehyde:ferredoxin oxidoreductase
MELLTHNIDFSTGYPSRANARGGLGAVMGSKKIKAVVIERNEAPHVFQYADKKRFETARARTWQKKNCHEMVI